MERPEVPNTPAGEALVSQRDQDTDLVSEIAVLQKTNVQTCDKEAVLPYVQPGRTDLILFEEDELLTAHTSITDPLDVLFPLEALEKSNATDSLGLDARNGTKENADNFIPDVNLLLDGIPFDLNQELTIPQISSDVVLTDEDTKPPCSNERIILGAAEGRLNKEGKEGSGHRMTPRVVARFVVPLRKALLCNPMSRIKGPGTKKMASSENALIEKKKYNKTLAKRTNLSIDEQATMLLMQASGIIDADGPITDDAHQKLGEQFVDPLHDEPVAGMRSALGLPGNGQDDVLSVLVGEAGVDDD